MQGVSIAKSLQVIDGSDRISLNSDRPLTSPTSDTFGALRYALPHPQKAIFSSENGRREF